MMQYVNCGLIFVNGSKEIFQFGITYDPTSIKNIDWECSLCHNLVCYRISDPFDCSGDPCHIAWIVRDNRILLQFLRSHYLQKTSSASCSNGTSFDQLDPNGFNQCEQQIPGKFLRYYSLYLTTSYFLKNHSQSSGLQVNQSYCPNDDSYSPCHCSPVGVHCISCSIVSIKTVFQRNVEWNQLHNFELRLLPEDLVVPADLLANHWVAHGIFIQCEFSFFPSIKIDPDAFRSSRNSTRSFDIFNCNVAGLDFHFLEGFHNLKHLSLKFNLNLYLALLMSPQTTPIPFPAFYRGLETITLEGNNLNDDTMDEIFKLLIDSPLVNSLRELDISRNPLTRIPRQISFFKQLKHLKIGLNVKMKTLLKA